MTVLVVIRLYATGVVAFVGALCALFVSWWPHRWSRLYFYLCLCGVTVGLLVGDFVHSRGTQRVSPRLPVLEASVTAVDVRMESDPWRLTNGTWSGRGTIERVYSDWAVVESTHSVVLSGAALEHLTWGSRFYTEASPVWLGDEADGVFFLRLDEVIRNRELAPFLALRRDVHGFIRERSAGWPEESRGLFMALFLGNRDELSPFLYDQVRSAGAAHVLALSGMHLGLVAAAFVVLVSPLRSRRITAIGVSLLSVGYLLLAGLRPSLVRAVIMLHVAMFFRLRDGHVSGLKTLCCTFLLHVLIFPADAQSLGFILSFSALAGIFVLTPLVMSLTGVSRKEKIKAGICAGLGAQLATAGAAWSFFGTVYPIGAVSSLIFTPLAALSLASGLVSLLPAGPVSGLSLEVLAWCRRGFDVASQSFSRVPGFSSIILLVVWMLLPLFLLFLVQFRYYLPSRLRGKWNRTRIARQIITRRWTTHRPRSDRIWKAGAFRQVSDSVRTSWSARRFGLRSSVLSAKSPGAGSGK
ncbi:MAG: ComEC/Rec2 family competence protein [Spirochaetaceae bacterium]